MNAKKNAVIIFCRYPSEGKVKTRLAAETSGKFAAQCYKLCAEHIFKECGKLIPDLADGYIFFPEKSKEEKIKKWAGSGFRYFCQEGNDLGEKMLHAFKEAAKLCGGNVLLVGTDIPDITSEILSDAFQKLESSDYVVGPARDGGFYLIGTKKPESNIFNGIKWSSGKVLDALAGNLKDKNQKTEFVNELIDIDTLSDIKLWLEDKQPVNNGAMENAIRCLLYDNGIKLA